MTSVSGVGMKCRASGSWTARGAVEVVSTPIPKCRSTSIMADPGRRFPDDRADSRSDVTCPELAWSTGGPAVRPRDTTSPRQPAERAPCMRPMP